MSDDQMSCSASIENILGYLSGSIRSTCGGAYCVFYRSKVPEAFHHGLTEKHEEGHESNDACHHCDVAVACKSSRCMSRTVNTVASSDWSCCHTFRFQKSVQQNVVYTLLFVAGKLGHCCNF